MLLAAVVLIGAGASVLGIAIQRDQSEVDRIDHETARISREVSLSPEENQQIAQIPPKDRLNSDLGRIGVFSFGLGLLFAAAGAVQKTQEME